MHSDGVHRFRGFVLGETLPANVEPSRFVSASEYRNATDVLASRLQHERRNRNRLVPINEERFVVLMLLERGAGGDEGEEFVAKGGWITVEMNRDGVRSTQRDSGMQLHPTDGLLPGGADIAPS